MIVVVMLLITVVSWVVYAFCVKKFFDTAAIISFIFGIFSSFILLVMISIVIIVHTSALSDAAAYRMKYESLTYQLENNLYDNDNDIGKKELYNQITNWNMDLARRKVLCKNIWIGIFWADIYDDFEFIELR